MVTDRALMSGLMISELRSAQWLPVLRINAHYQIASSLGSSIISSLIGGEQIAGNLGVIPGAVDVALGIMLRARAW